jgi:hypothetical protein
VSEPHGYVLAAEAKPDVWATAARILGKLDAAVGQQLGGLDLSDRVLHQAPNSWRCWSVIAVRKYWISTVFPEVVIESTGAGQYFVLTDLYK